MKISVIVAMDRKGVIGKDNDLPWHLTTDMKNFREVTMGKPVIMGRKTHESIGKALPGRKNIIITRNRSYTADGCSVSHSFDDALAQCEGSEEVIVIGGRAVYELGLERAHRIYLTEVDADVTGDVYFPAIDRTEWDEIERTEYKADDGNDYAFSISVLERRHPLYW